MAIFQSLSGNIKKLKLDNLIQFNSDWLKKFLSFTTFIKNNEKILAKTLKIDTLEHGALLNAGVKFKIQFWIEIFIFIST